MEHSFAVVVFHFVLSNLNVEVSIFGYLGIHLAFRISGSLDVVLWMLPNIVLFFYKK